MKAYQKGFSEDRCSYRTKYDEGIPGDVIEHQTIDSASSLAGVSLLRPI